MSSTPGDSRRRAEIEAKRAKLAELKRAREERSSRLQAGRSGSAAGFSSQGAGSESATPVSGATSRKDVDDLVATLVGTPSGPSSRTGRQSVTTDDMPSLSFSPRKPAGTGAPASEFSGSDSVGPGTTLVSRADGQIVGPPPGALRGIPDMIDVETELFEFPQKERVYYTKEVQTMSTSSDTESDGGNNVGADVGTAGVSAATEAAIRKRILDEQELERERELQENMKREEEELERQIEEELRVMSPEETQAIFGTADFTDFVEHSSKVVERALTDAYDYLKDYTIVGTTGGDASEGRKVKQTRCFYDDKLCKGRSITGLDWSSKHPELVVASYSRPDFSGGETPDGLVLVWNIHLLDRPEFVFQAQTDVLSVAFSPFHPNLVIGGTYSGQILIWDTRAKQLPVLKTPLSASGHTHPVYNIQVVGTQNANHLITASTDGLVCSWMLDMLAQPQDSLELLNSSHPKTDEVSITALNFPLQETTQFWVGSEEGNIYLASRFDRAGSKAGMQLGEVYKGHAAPVTGLDFHKSMYGNVDFSDLFLSSSMDWTAKLWRVRSQASSSSVGAGKLGGPGSGAGGAAGSAATSTGTTNSTSASAAGGAGAGGPAREVVPLLSFEESNDYIMDVKWHHGNPALFGMVDGTGHVHLYHLLHDLERPLVSVRASNQGLNKLAFDRGKPGAGVMDSGGPGRGEAGGKEGDGGQTGWGKHVALGGADGRVYVLDISSVGAQWNAEKDGLELQRVLARLAGSSGKAAGAAANDGFGGANSRAAGTTTGLGGVSAGMSGLSVR